MLKFKAVLQPDPAGSGTFVLVPRQIIDKLRLRGRPKINSVIAGHPYRGSLMPMGDGSFCLGVLKSIQAAEGLKRGDTITVELELDTAPRVVDPPDELRRILLRDAGARAAWGRLSYTGQKEIAMGITEAKKPETRDRRLAAALEKLRG